MRLTDTHLHYFDTNVVALEHEKKKALRNQLKYLVGRLEAKIKDEGGFRVTHIYRAGSLRKGTILRPRDGINVDADVVFYLNVDASEATDVDRLNEIIVELLLAVYPSKVRADFEIQPRTVGIHFVDSGLDVDIVPVVEVPDGGGDALQPSFQGGTPTLTNTPKQLEFIYRRHQTDARYRTLVRLVKFWRNVERAEHDELRKLGSFLIELILAHLQDTCGTATSLEDGLERFWNYLVDTNFSDRIAFSDYGEVTQFPNDAVVVLDPVNAKNNVAGKITETARDVIVARAEHAWEKLHTARRLEYKGATVETWKAAFGRRFKIEDAV